MATSGGWDDPAVEPPPRSARLLGDGVAGIEGANPIRFAVEPPPSTHECPSCGNPVTTDGGLAFGILAKGRRGAWYHAACAAPKVRARALTEGVRGWAGLGPCERKDVLRALIG